MQRRCWEYLTVKFTQSDWTVGQVLQDVANSPFRPRYAELDNIFSIHAIQGYNNWSGSLPDITRYLDDFPADVEEQLAIWLANYDAAHTPLWKIEDHEYSGWGVYPLQEDGSSPGPDLSELLEHPIHGDSDHRWSMLRGHLHFADEMHFLDVAGKAGWELVAMDPVHPRGEGTIHMAFKRPYTPGSRDWETLYWETDEMFVPWLVRHHAGKK